VVEELARESHLALICGHYEGVDERVREHLVDDEISIGDYVLTGGELPALVLVDAVARLIPGVLGKAESAEEESFRDGLLEYPQYTRPEEYRGWRVPEVLLSGHHAMIARWRRRESLRRTLERRPDLLACARLTADDLEVLKELGADEALLEELGRTRGEARKV
jgi:tRNA (guanine37-N1)-methyltransferase